MRTDDQPQRSSISLTQSFEVTVPARQRGFFVPQTEWEHLRERVSGIGTPGSTYTIVGSVALSVGGSSLVAALSLPQEITVSGAPAQLICWGMAAVFAFCGVVALLVARKERSMMAYSKKDVAKEMDRLKARFCASDTDVPSESADRQAHEEVARDIVRYGDILRLRHVSTGRCLHSHARRYQHSGSSGQQQVTAYDGKDSNDFWLVKGPSGKAEDYAKGYRVANRDIIRLEHVNTKRNLHSHEGYRSPISGQQEVTAFGNNGVGDANDNWRLELETDDSWDAGRRVRLIHVNTNYALHSHTCTPHPEFTSGQQEVTGYGDRDNNDWWIAERP